MPHAGAGQGRFTSGVACSDNDDIVIGWVSIQKNNLNPLETGMFHVKHVSILFLRRSKNDFFSIIEKNICQPFFYPLCFAFLRKSKLMAWQCLKFNSSNAYLPKSQGDQFILFCLFLWRRSGFLETSYYLLGVSLRSSYDSPFSLKGGIRIEISQSEILLHAEYFSQVNEMVSQIFEFLWTVRRYPPSGTAGRSICSFPSGS